jgi:multimeric flavodoxin WrbA
MPETESLKLRQNNMSEKIIIISGSPKKDGNTATLIKWFEDGVHSAGVEIEIINASMLKSKVKGCMSCRACQKREKYGCVINDDVKQTLDKMAKADIIVMATPLYFFSMSAQLKAVFDRMFSLYKWDNKADTMKTVLKGKTLALIASAFEDVGLDALEKPFKLTADYSGMKYMSLLLPNAGVSGDIKNKENIRKKVISFGKAVRGASGIKP